MLVGRSGGGGGCMLYRGAFGDVLIPSGMMGGGSGEFVTIDGVAPDDVARIDALLATGRRARVPARDNASLVDIPRAGLPARLVAYDAAARVISRDAVAADGLRADKSVVLRMSFRPSGPAGRRPLEQPGDQVLRCHIVSLSTWGMRHCKT